MESLRAVPLALLSYVTSFLLGLGMMMLVVTVSARAQSDCVFECQVWLNEFPYAVTLFTAGLVSLLLLWRVQLASKPGSGAGGD